VGGRLEIPREGHGRVRRRGTTPKTFDKKRKNRTKKKTKKSKKKKEKKGARSTGNIKWGIRQGREGKASRTDPVTRGGVGENGVFFIFLEETQITKNPARGGRSRVQELPRHG